MVTNVSTYTCVIHQRVCLLAVLGYDGVDDFFPCLLELIQSKIYGTGIPPVVSGTTTDTSEQCGDEDAETVGCSQEFRSSASATQYYFSSGHCCTYVKPLSHSQLQQLQPDHQSELEHVVAVNGFVEHWRQSWWRHLLLVHSTWTELNWPTQLHDDFIGHMHQHHDLIGCSETRAVDALSVCSLWTLPLLLELQFADCISVQFKCCERTFTLHQLCRLPLNQCILF